ncbi:hypothetical protein [Micromonospora sp. DT47]|uniref:hypothetical protein n=1 Tax=Micromonospora sp. DT47 TaxID=3393431 RepID=UPI003CFB1667
MPDPFFADLYRDTENLTWAATEQVRRRGRQRTRRTRAAAVLASVVAVGVVATGAVALAGRPGPVPVIPATPSPSVSPTTPAPTPAAPTPVVPPPSVTPSQTTRSPKADLTSPGRTSPSTPADPAVPAAAMLRLADLPDGFRAAGSDLDGDWTLESVTIYCSGESPSITPGEVARRGAVFDSPTARITQRVTRHSGDQAGTAMDRVRELVSGCKFERQGNSLSILGERLGGEESLLVGALIEGVPSRWLFVRQGDLVAQVWLDKDTTPTDARRYAEPVADRLCAGTDDC